MIGRSLRGRMTGATTPDVAIVFVKGAEVRGILNM